MQKGSLVRGFPDRGKPGRRDRHDKDSHVTSNIVGMNNCVPRTSEHRAALGAGQRGSANAAIDLQARLPLPLRANRAAQHALYLAALWLNFISATRQHAHRRTQHSAVDYPSVFCDADTLTLCTLLTGPVHSISLQPALAFNRGRARKGCAEGCFQNAPKRELTMHHDHSSHDRALSFLYGTAVYGALPSTRAIHAPTD
jgi:hypothetical protein